MRLIALSIVFLFSCDHTRSSDCVFGASSPIDVTLTNDCDSDMDVTFYSYNKLDNEFELIKTIPLDKDESKTVCIDNEGQVTEGVYVKMTDKTKLIKLTWAETFRLNLCDNSFVIDKSKGPK